MFALRPATVADYPAIVDAINQTAMAATTVEAYTRQQQNRPAHLPYLLQVAETEGGRFAGYAVAGHDTDLRPGSFFLMVRVTPGERGRGAGAALLDSVVHWVRDQGGRQLEVTLREGAQDEAIGWALRRGFVVESRVQRSDLDMAGWDPAPYEPAVTRLVSVGLRLATLAELGATEKNLRRFHSACQEWERHVPGRGPLTPPWEQWRRQINADPGWDPACVLIALDGDGRWAGLTFVEKQADGSWYTHLTAMDPAFRGRGLGRALKAAVPLQARREGVALLWTFNHLNNGPMLAINDWLGYKPVFTLSQLTLYLG